MLLNNYIIATLFKKIIIFVITTLKGVNVLQLCFHTERVCEHRPRTRSHFYFANRTERPTRRFLDKDITCGPARAERKGLTLINPCLGFDAGTAPRMSKTNDGRGN